MTSPQTLSEADRRLLAGWAAACAARVLPLLDAGGAAGDQLRDALRRAQTFADGDSTAATEIAQRMVAVTAARSAGTPAGAAAARSIAQAAAVAHMGAHAYGAAAYAVKAVSLANPGAQELVEEEVRWQLDALTLPQREALRRLPPAGTDSSGPLGAGLLASGFLGGIVRRLQAGVAEDWGPATTGPPGIGDRAARWGSRPAVGSA